MENNQSFHSIAEFFVRFKTLSEREVSLQEEKSNVSSCWIGVSSTKRGGALRDNPNNGCEGD